MIESIFPSEELEEGIKLDDVIGDVEKEDIEELPLFKEYDYNFNTNEFIYVNGKLKVLEGNEALKIWIKKALLTPRLRYKAYTEDYGHEFEDLIGETYSKEIIESEVKRLIEECILINPYITSVENIVAYIDGHKVGIDVTIQTVYGEVEVNV